MQKSLPALPQKILCKPLFSVLHIQHHKKNMANHTASNQICVCKQAHTDLLYYKFPTNDLHCRSKSTWKSHKDYAPKMLHTWWARAWRWSIQKTQFAVEELTKSGTIILLSNNTGHSRIQSIKTELKCLSYI